MIPGPANAGDVIHGLIFLFFTGDACVQRSEHGLGGVEVGRAPHGREDTRRCLFCCVYDLVGVDSIRGDKGVLPLRIALDCHSVFVQVLHRACGVKRDCSGFDRPLLRLFVDMFGVMGILRVDDIH